MLKDKLEILNFSGNPEIPTLEDEIAALDDLLETLSVPDERVRVDQMKVTLNRLTRSERAEQIAIEVAFQNDWLAGLEVLQGIFERHGWGRARVAIQRIIALGATPDEVAIARDVRELWRDTPEFWVSLWRGTRGTFPGTPFHVLSWSLALGIVKRFQSIPVIEEVELVLHQLFNHWRDERGLIAGYPAFQLWLATLVHDKHVDLEFFVLDLVRS
jgi:hypothetical protein